MCVGAEFSSEDVSLLYSKVFHVPSNVDEAHVAMKKVKTHILNNKTSSSKQLSFDQIFNHLHGLFQIAGGNNSWSCAGENMLDVLLEMEREREKKEKVVNEMIFSPSEVDMIVSEKTLIPTKS